MTCKICKARNTQIFEQDDRFSECSNCGVIFQNDLSVTVSYDEKYVSQYDKYHTTRMMSCLRAGFVRGATTNRNGDRILDVGFGNGDFLRVMEMGGWDIFGHDLHSANYQIPRVSLEEVINSEWDVVTFFDSLEHFPDPTIFSEIVAKYIIVTVPDPTLVLDFKSWKHWKPGEHLYHFTNRSLCTLFADYDLVDVSSYEDIIRGAVINAGRKIRNTMTCVFEGTK